jgi:hypothetical protein
MLIPPQKYTITAKKEKGGYFYKKNSREGEK